MSGQVPRATSTVKTSTATPSSPLTLAARTSMPWRASVPATAESRPGRSGAATTTCGGSRDTEGSPLARTSSMRARYGVGIVRRPAGLRLAGELAVGPPDELAPPVPPSRVPRPRGPWRGCRPRSARRAGAASPGFPRPGRRWPPWWGRPGRGAWRCRAGGGGAAPGRPVSRRRRAAKPMRVAMSAHELHARPRCGRPGSPCRCRAAARRSSRRSGRSTESVSSDAKAAASSRCRSTV